MTWLAIGAGLAFGLALVMLATFFATKNERYDRVAEWSFVAFAILAVPTILTVGGRLAYMGVVTQATTVVGVVAVVILGLAELGSVLGVVDFRRLAPVVSVAFFGFLAWIGLTSAQAIVSGGLPSELGWFGLATIALGVVIVGWILRTPGVLRGDAEPRPEQMRIFFVPMIGMVAWMAWLGLSL